MARQIELFNRRTQRLRRPYRLPAPGVDLGDALRAREGRSFEHKFVGWFTEQLAGTDSVAGGSGDDTTTDGSTVATPHAAPAHVLVRAIAAGDAAAVRACLDADPGLVQSRVFGAVAPSLESDGVGEAIAGDGLTPLHWAALHGHLVIVKMLCHHEPPADVLARDRQGATPLMLAVDFGHDQVVNYLCNPTSGPGHVAAQVGSADRRGWTALHDAAYVGCGHSCRNMLS